jgi:hypothetical protein
MLQRYLRFHWHECFLGEPFALEDPKADSQDWLCHPDQPPKQA